jgi:hypothetical protein
MPAGCCATVEQFRYYPHNRILCKCDGRDQGISGKVCEQQLKICRCRSRARHRQKMLAEAVPPCKLIE